MVSNRYVSAGSFRHIVAETEDGPMYAMTELWTCVACGSMVGVREKHDQFCPSSVWAVDPTTPEDGKGDVFHVKHDATEIHTRTSQ